MPVGGEPEAEPELGVVLEERVRPGRAAPVGVGRPRRGRQVAAVDRRAAGRVGDHQPVAEQLREELQVRRLAAARAGAGELEQRLQELGAAHRAEVDPRPVARGQRLEERDVVPLGGDQRLARREVDRLADRVARRDDRARLDAQLAAGAVLDVDLQRVAGVGQPDGLERSRLEPVRCALQAGLVVVPGADHAVRADEAAVAALDAEIGVPDRDQLRDVALLVGRRAARIGAVHRQRADRQVVAPAGQHLRGDGANELGRVRGDDRRQPAARGHLLGHLDPVQAVQRAVDRGLVALDHLGAAPAVGLGDRRLDPLDRLLARHHAGDGEEAGLQDDVDPSGEADLAGDPAGVDHVQVDVLGEDLLLDRAGQRIPHLVRRARAVEQQRRAVRRPAEHVGPVEQPELVAADEARLLHEVGRPDRLRPEAQVRDRLRARLLRVVDEVALRVQALLARGS